MHAFRHVSDARGGRPSPLAVATDWPGYFPNGPHVVRLLIDAGADPNVNIETGETPLHWAASSDDADVAAVLIDGGADIEAPKGSIGTPLSNAVGYACWNVARLLAARDAKVDQLWQASALGLMARLEELVSAAPPSKDELFQALWHACSGGQRRTAELLVELGAQLDWIPEYAKGTPLDAASGRDTQRENLIGWLRDRGACSTEAGLN